MGRGYHDGVADSSARPGAEGRSTLDDVRTTTSRPDLWVRRAAVALLIVLVVAAAVGLLGVHSTTASATANGYTLTVTYARIARAGWDVPLRIEVVGAEPLAGKQITVGIDREYLSLFETQGVWPDPADESGDLDTVQWEFDGPDDGNDLTVDYDAYIQPSAQIGADATIGLQVDDVDIVSVPISTLLFP